MRAELYYLGYVVAYKNDSGAAGHNFPDRLSEDEKRAVLEYLKTL